MRNIFTLILVIISIGNLQSQVGINNPSPDDDAVLDIQSTNKGLLIPRLTTTQREAMSSGAGFPQGMMVYDTDLDILFVGYGNDTNSTKWYAMNPWKTEYRTNNNTDTAHMTTMTASGVKHGNIGIGTSTPSTKLEVKGTITATNFIAPPGGSFKGDGIVPIGGIIMWSGTTAPLGWALCNGQTVNGYKTPNLNQRFIVGYDPSKTEYNGAGNLSTKGTTAGKQGGNNSVTLTSAEMPRHNHTIEDKAHHHWLDWAHKSNSSNTASYNIFKTGYVLASTTSGTEAMFINYVGTGETGTMQVATSTTGITSTKYQGGKNGNNEQYEDGVPFDNLPPYYVLAYIMRVY